MKRLTKFIFILTLIYSCSVFAVNGPFIGLSLGYTNNIFNIHQDASAIIFGKTTGQNSQSNRGIAGGFQGQIAAGYNYDINKVRLGAEITAQGPRLVNDDKNSDGSFRAYKSSYAYGVNLVPGYLVTNRSLVYLKIGAKRGKFTYKELSDSGIAIVDRSFRTIGMNLGIGTGIYLTKNLMLNLEYDYTRYPEEKTTTILNLPENIVVIVKNKIRPQVHTFMLGMDYQFNLFA